MKNKIFIALIAIIVLGGVGVSLVTKGSFAEDLSINDIENYDGFNINLLNTNEENLYFENSLTNFDELVEASELVIKAQMINEREKVTQATLTPINVKEVLKGDLQTDEIYLYEPAFFWSYIDDPSNGNYLTGGYQLMQEGKKYILFLQSLKSPKAYNLSEKEERSFLPLSEMYGKIPLQSDWKPKVIDHNLGIYKDIEDFEILTTEESVLQNYKQLAERVRGMYE